MSVEPKRKKRYNISPWVPFYYIMLLKFIHLAECKFLCSYTHAKFIKRMFRFVFNDNDCSCTVHPITYV